MLYIFKGTLANNKKTVALEDGQEYTVNWEAASGTARAAGDCIVAMDPVDPTVVCYLDHIDVVN